MTEFSTGTESETGQKLAPQRIFEIIAVREARLSHADALHRDRTCLYALARYVFCPGKGSGAAVSFFTMWEPTLQASALMGGL